MKQGSDDLDSDSLVEREYATTTGLDDRNRAYREFRQGPGAETEVLAAIEAAGPRTYLEVGCGTGEFAARVQAAIGAEVIAIDSSRAMVDAARRRGLDARVEDVQSLPFDDEAFDCVFVGWVLYHVPDLPLAVQEIARVLRPDGLAIITTHSNKRGGDLGDILGVPIEATHYSFSSENGPELLSSAFAEVEAHDLDYALRFPSGDELRRYVSALPTLKRYAEHVPETMAPITLTPAGITMFVGRGPKSAPKKAG